MEHINISILQRMHPMHCREAYFMVFKYTDGVHLHLQSYSYANLYNDYFKNEVESEYTDIYNLRWNTLIY